MSLISDAMTDFVMMEKQRKPDGEGGFFVVWTEGAPFKAAITFDSSMEARTAEKQGVTSLYTVTAPKNTRLEYHDVIKRLSDGKIFRITSDGDDKITPATATFQLMQATAEEFNPA